MRIANRTIGITHPTLIIAEIGVNHDGQLRRALELVQIAEQCGADAVKLQIFTATALMHGSSQFATYQQERVDDANPSAMLRRYELSPTHLRQVIDAIRKASMLPIATPFSPSDVQVISDLQLPAVKVASPDLINQPLLQRIANLKLPIIASTGAATLDEVKTTCTWLTNWKSDFALLHCISSYPTPTDQTNLSWITEMSQLFPVPLGFSDHTTETIAGALAVAAGATIIEKHLTYDRSAPGPDHSASADPEQFANYVKLIRLADTMRGAPGKRVLDIEQDVRRVSRQSLVTVRDLSLGQILSQQDLTVQRPGTGISAASAPQAVGKRLKHAVTRGTLLQWDMLADAA